MPRLQVRIGPNRFETSTAYVNHSDKPTEIDTPYFAGRVLVLVKDFAGVTPDGSAPKSNNAFFDGRSRKFAILIEGKFKRRDGVAPYNGDEVEFGSDFDYLPKSFPRAPLDAGLKVAKWIDPAMHYEMGEKPFIMSPYTAAVNTLCAYPSPDALSRAVVLAMHDGAHPHADGEEQGASLVPKGSLDEKHKWSSAPPVWRFLGLRRDPKVEEFIDSHQELQPPSNTSSPSGSMSNSFASKPPRPRFNHHPSSLALGTTTGGGRGSLDIPSTIDSERSSHNASPILSNDRQRASSPSRINGSSAATSGTSSPASSLSQAKPKKKSSKFSLSTLMGALDVTGSSSKNEHHEHLLTPEQVLAAEHAAVAKRQANDASYKPNASVERELGPWRFADESVDAAEATDFVFLDPDHPKSVAQRRKYFCANGGQNRKDFTYDPDIIYTTSFFAPFCDLNTLDVKIGPVSINVANFIGSGDLMPIRYTLRSTRQAPSSDPSAPKGTQESEGFCTIEFKLVD
ncbi:uncharacterized protein JCM6883_000950 [Sporobolomyces salmoneus]|uniref:uncharacterized protein n=1 Tax=Sporobolomyces salmoneus TaxID=183962 RepID=UPI00317B17D4